MITRNVTEYIDDNGNSPFAKWFAGINAQAAAKVSTALYRLEQGNFSNTQSVGKGVFEYKIEFGPAYRIYFGQDGDVLVILQNVVLKNGKTGTSSRPGNFGQNIKDAGNEVYSIGINKTF